MDLSIWRDQVINRDFKKTDHHSSEFRTFIWNIAGKDKNKYKAFQTVIGYLLHSYKDRSNNKAIIFNDEAISDVPNGRSGLDANKPLRAAVAVSIIFLRSEI